MELIVIETDGTTTRKSIPVGDSWTLEQLQKEVGGYIEICRIDSSIGEGFDLDGTTIMLVDEDGMYKNLTYNSVASSFAEQTILGTAVLINEEALD